MKNILFKVSLVLSLLFFLTTLSKAEDLFGWPQRYTESSVEYVYDMGTGCLTTIEQQYETTDCPIAPALCSEGTEWIAEHQLTACPE